MAIQEKIEDKLILRLADQGIGAYEYAGATGIDSRLGFELETETIEVPVRDDESLPVKLALSYIDGEYHTYLNARLVKFEDETATYEIELA